MPVEILKHCETPNQLIEYVGLMNWIMKLPACDRNDEVRMHNTRIRKKQLPPHFNLINFIMNRVPSDLYRMRNPKLKIEKDKKSKNGHLEVNQKSTLRKLPTNLGGRWGFINRPT